MTTNSLRVRACVLIGLSALGSIFIKRMEPAFAPPIIALLTAVWVNWAERTRSVALFLETLGVLLLAAATIPFVVVMIFGVVLAQLGFEPSGALGYLFMFGIYELPAGMILALAGALWLHLTESNVARQKAPREG